MDAYPLNLILAVITASATIFLGFLPTKTISSTFFSRQTSLAILGWAIVAFTSPPKVMHFMIMYGFLSFASWWSFRRDKVLAGKMWLSLASGLGVSMGVMLILKVTPRAFPPDLPHFNETLLLASIYLGGAIIGLAYVCFALVQGTGTNSGVTQAVIRRHVGLLLALTIARAIVISIELLQPPMPGNDRIYSISGMWHSGSMTYLSTSTRVVGKLLLIPMIILISLAFFAYRAAGFSSRIQPTKFLVAIILIGFLTEILARFLIL